MEYRKDIDALRAFAVLIVLFYHANFSFFKGGFIGVDIFFVISGFLITTITTSQLGKGNFLFLNFYSRRILRLLPVLFVVVLSTIISSFYLLDVNSFDNFGGSVSSTGTISTNLFFLNSSQDYFHQNDLQSSPLLHLWSLSIEEQFYLMLPFTLFLFFRFMSKRWIIVSLSLLSTASLCYSIFLVGDNQSEAFYSIWSRSWELLTGGILALLYPQLPSLNPKIANTAYTFSVVGLIALSYFYNHETLFPGLMAIAPSILTVIIIYSGKYLSEFIKKIIEIRPIISVGLISYSLYLWHWPIFVLSSSSLLGFYSLPTPNRLEQILLSFSLSYLTYFLIEQPFRKIRLSKIGNITTIATMFLVLATFYFGGNFLRNANKQDAIIRQPFVTTDYFEQLPRPKDVPYRRWQLDYSDIKKLEKDEAPIILGDKKASPKAILVGDSYAAMWGDGLNKLLQERNESIILLARESCPFLVNLNNKSIRRCYELNDARNEFIKRSKVKDVYLASLWEVLYTKDYNLKYGNEKVKINNIFESGLLETLDSLREKNISFVLLHPPFKSKASTIYLENIKQGRKVATDGYLKDFMKLSYNKSIFATLRKAKRDYKLKLINPNKKLCPNGKCITTTDGKVIIHDMNHLNKFGSHFLAEIFFF